MSRNFYNPQVLVNNWKEESHRNHEREKIFFGKLENEELLIQKMSNLYSDLNRVTYETTSSAYLNFGDMIQIQHSLTPYCLSVNADPGIVFQNLNPAHFSIRLTRLERFPTVKSAFTICSAHSTRDSRKMPLRYGNNFLLSINVMHKQMYLGCRFSTSGGITNDKSSDIFLDDNPSRQSSFWNIQYIEPEWRFEHEGCKVPLRTKIILNNTFTNQCLAINQSTDIAKDGFLEMTPCHAKRATSSEREVWKVISSFN